MSDVPAEPSLIEFPSLFPIKVMGENSADFENAMFEIARRFDPALDQSRVASRPSSGGKYLALTFTVMATSRQQLDDLYRALSSHPQVRMVL
jgi:hypothetical protein